MKISLRHFESNDLKSLNNWSEDIDAQQYMTRLLPNKFDGACFSQRGLLSWYMIVVNEQDVGTIWLEKDSCGEKVATLGIMIGKKEMLGQGIGEEAITLAIENSHSDLSFRAVRLNVRVSNNRAISCYKKCGFTVIRRGVKLLEGGNGIPFFTMELKVV